MTGTITTDPLCAPHLRRRLHLLGGRCPKVVSGAERALGAARASGSRRGCIGAARFALHHDVQKHSSTTAAAGRQIRVARCRRLHPFCCSAVVSQTDSIDRDIHFNHTNSSVSLSVETCRRK